MKGIEEQKNLKRTNRHSYHNRPTTQWQGMSENNKKVDYNTPEYAKIHQESMADFNKAVSSQREQRDQSLKDRRFYSIAGAQWEDEYGAQFENKPKL